jgi:hypothetical protein
MKEKMRRKKYSTHSLSPSHFLLNKVPQIVPSHPSSFSISDSPLLKLRLPHHHSQKRIRSTQIEGR